MGKLPTGYRSVSLPSVLVEDIERVIADRDYASVSEFVKDAIRRRLEELRGGI